MSWMAPLVKKTWLVATSAVFPSTARSIASSGTLTPSGLSTTTTSTSPDLASHW
jgi:hypothetical protein